MTELRSNIIKMKGNPLTLCGPEIKVGDNAPDFLVYENIGQTYSLDNFKDKIKIFSVIVSVDTPVCDKQTRKFNEEAVNLGDDIVIVTLSMDLPFALKRYCGSANIDNVKVLSDYKEASFGHAYGLLIDELRLLSRAIIVVDKSNIVRHIEYVEEITQEPNYDSALEVVRGL